MANITLHRSTGIRVSRSYPHLSNFIELKVTDSHGRETEIGIFGLPAEQVAALIEAVGDGETIVDDTPSSAAA